VKKQFLEKPHIYFSRSLEGEILKGMGREIMEALSI